MNILEVCIKKTPKSIWSTLLRMEEDYYLKTFHVLILSQNSGMKVFCLDFRLLLQNYAMKQFFVFTWP